MKKYKSIYKKNGLEVLVNTEDFWCDYKVRLNNHHAKNFKGETAWQDVTRFVHDQAIEFWDFNVDDIYENMVNKLVDELAKR